MPTTDEDLVQRFARAQTPVDTVDVVSRVKLEARKVRRRRQLGTVALAFIVIAGTIGGVVALDRAFRAVPRAADGASSASASPSEPAQSPAVEGPDGLDIGLASNICQAARLGGLNLVADDVPDTAWTGYLVNEAGRCPTDPDRQHWLVAVDNTRDGRADFWGPLPLTNCPYVGCEPLGAIDLDADGDQELVITTLFSIRDEMFFSIGRSGGGYSIVPIDVSAPGHPEAGIDPDKPLVTSAGGDEGYSAWIRCESYPTSPILVFAWSNAQVESNDPEEWHETKLRLQSDGTFHVLDATDLTLPQGQDPGFELSDAPACGVDFRGL